MMSSNTVRTYYKPTEEELAWWRKEALNRCWSVLQALRDDQCRSMGQMMKVFLEAYKAAEDYESECREKARAANPNLHIYSFFNTEIIVCTAFAFYDEENFPIDEVQPESAAGGRMMAFLKASMAIQNFQNAANKTDPDDSVSFNASMAGLALRLLKERA